MMLNGCGKKLSHTQMEETWWELLVPFQLGIFSFTHHENFQTRFTLITMTHLLLATVEWEKMLINLLYKIKQKIENCILNWINLTLIVQI